MRFLEQLPRFIYFAAIFGLVFLIDINSWRGMLVLGCIVGAIWLGKKLFPVFYRIDQDLRSAREKSRDQEVEGR